MFLDDSTANYSSYTLNWSVKAQINKSPKSHFMPLIPELDLHLYRRDYGVQHFSEACKIYELSKEWPRRTLDSYSKLDHLKQNLMYSKETFNRFCKLSPLQQSQISKYSANSTARIVDMYLRALENVGNPPIVFVHLDLHNVDEFTEAVRVKNPDFPSISNQFVNVTSYLSEAQLKGWSLMSLLYLLAVKHGEEIVLDILERFVDENENWGSVDLVELSEKWADFSSYPVEWSVSLLKQVEKTDESEIIY